MTNTNQEPSYTQVNIPHKFDIRRILTIIAVVGVIGFIMYIANSYAFPEKSTLQLCQESYMKSLNEIYRENEKIAQKCTEEFGKDIYKLNKCTSSPLPIPENKCWVITNSWTEAPAIPGVPPSKKLEGLDESNIVISDSLNSQEKEKIAHYKNIICKRKKSSPLCKEEWLLEKLYILTEDRLPWKQFFPILLWITNAESSFWTNFARDKIGWFCDWRNNWGGTKYQILDNNTRVYKRNLNGFIYANSVDQYWCNLYPFKSVEEYWITKVNGMRYGWKNCVDHVTPIKCLSYWYVWDPKVSEQSWVNNVSIFLD